MNGKVSEYLNSHFTIKMVYFCKQYVNVVHVITDLPLDSHLERF